MKYMGSKARIVHEILPIMLDKEHDTFVDAFCGVVALLRTFRTRIAGLPTIRIGILSKCGSIFRMMGLSSTILVRRCITLQETAIMERIISSQKQVSD